MNLDRVIYRAWVVLIVGVAVLVAWAWCDLQRWAA